jgi:multidrug efflux pump subunit AcrB
MRPELARIAKSYGARMAIAEVPPGPPVLQTLVAEIYGPTETDRLRLATQVREIFEKVAGVVDVDWYQDADHPKCHFIVDKEKAALNGINEAHIGQTLQCAISGLSLDLMHLPQEKEDVNIYLEIPRSAKTYSQQLMDLKICTQSLQEKRMVPLGALVDQKMLSADKTIFHKNLKNVIYVTADVAGTIESPVYAILKLNNLLKQGTSLKFYNLSQPTTEWQPAMKWDGEWHITLEVFRDLGIAFIVVLVLIYILMVGWFHSFITPLIVMVAIPFSLIGILPAHALLGAFFTATSMIGFMAGAGIVVRNSIILVDFIELRRKEGSPLREAVVEAGAVRFRPMFLTALAVIVGASVILKDPIFQGLALSLMAGEIASLLISRMVVPALYYHVFRTQNNQPREKL